MNWFSRCNEQGIQVALTTLYIQMTHHHFVMNATVLTCHISLRYWKSASSFSMSCLALLSTSLSLSLGLTSSYPLNFSIKLTLRPLLLPHDYVGGWKDFRKKPYYNQALVSLWIHVVAFHVPWNHISILCVIKPAPSINIPTHSYK